GFYRLKKAAQSGGLFLLNTSLYKSSMTKLYFQEFNPSGKKTAIFVHGLGATSDSWGYQFEAFTQAGYRVIAPDMRGFGKTPYSGGDINVKIMADDLFKLVQGLGIREFDLIGLSMGGAISQQFALDHPEMVRKLALANTAARFMARKGGVFYYLPRYALFPLCPSKLRAKIIAWYIFPQKGCEQYRKEFESQILEGNQFAYMRAAASLIKYDLYEQISQIKAPTIVFTGTRDKTTPLAMQNYLCEQIAGAKHIILEGGHVTAVDSHREFNKELLDFLG
ncbi:MAG: hypothetical protein COV36_05110, partial [Alphaproteobacteria bacterium CG11_big_fil_rev_8_21_14_0_20_44_7]